MKRSSLVAAGRLAALLAVLSLSFSCDSGGDGPTGPTQPRIARISVVPAEFAVSEGNDWEFTARAVDSDWNTIPGVEITWRIDDPDIALVVAPGRLLGRHRAGSTVLHAEAGGVSAEVSGWNDLRCDGGAPVVGTSRAVEPLVIVQLLPWATHGTSGLARNWSINPGFTLISVDAARARFTARMSSSRIAFLRCNEWVIREIELVDE